MKKLQLISKNERFKIIPKDFPDTVFYYRRSTTTAYQAIIKNNIVKGGKVDLNSVGIEVLESFVIGWDGIIDENGNGVPFDANFCKNLPDEIQAELIEGIRGIGGESVQEKKKK